MLIFCHYDQVLPQLFGLWLITGLNKKSDTVVHPSLWFPAVQQFLWYCRVLITAAVEKNVREMKERWRTPGFWWGVCFLQFLNHMERGGAWTMSTLLRKMCLKGITDSGTHREWNGMYIAQYTSSVTCKVKLHLFQLQQHFPKVDGKTNF